MISGTEANVTHIVSFFFFSIKISHGLKMWLKMFLILTWHVLPLTTSLMNRLSPGNSVLVLIRWPCGRFLVNQAKDGGVVFEVSSVSSSSSTFLSVQSFSKSGSLADGPWQGKSSLNARPLHPSCGVTMSKAADRAPAVLRPHPAFSLSFADNHL